MSIPLLNLAFKAAALGTNQRFVLVVLADHANAAGKCYPSIARLMKRTGLCERTVQHCIKSLRQAGYIEVQANAGPRGANIYIVHAHPAADAPPQEMHPAGDASAPRNKCAHPPAGDAPKPLNNHQEPEIDSPYIPQKLEQVVPRKASRQPKKNSKCTETPAGGLANGCTSLTEEFEGIWERYPRKVAKGAAREAWRKARGTTTFREISAPLAQFIGLSIGADQKFTPHLSTWLNQERWADDQTHAANRSQTSADRLNGLGASSDATTLPKLPRKLPEIEWGNDANHDI